MERFRFYQDGAVFFVTFSIVEWLPVFVSAEACRFVVDSLNFCHRDKGLRINAYVIMPTHFHAIVFHETFQAAPLENVLTEFRKFTGRKICDYCSRKMPAAFLETFRNAAGDDRTHRCWQPTRHPVQIESEAFWQTKFDYLHENPYRKGLVIRPEHWRFSSASYWIGEKRTENPVQLSALRW